MNAIQSEALSRAQTGQSVGNYAAIFEGFAAKGIPEADIQPRVNIYTFLAWKALGRSVRKGEHGVKVHTFVPMKDAADPDNPEAPSETTARPRTTTVFHISQTREV